VIVFRRGGGRNFLLLGRHRHRSDVLLMTLLSMVDFLSASLEARGRRHGCGNA